MRPSYFLYFILSVIIIGEAVGTGLLPMARGHLFSLFASKGGAIPLALLLYFLTYFSIDFFQSVKGYVVTKVSLIYRRIRTDRVNNTMKEKVFSGVGLPTNVPQRIQEDIKLSYTCRIYVWVEYVISALILMQLILINWTSITLVVSSLIYAGVSVVIAILFNPRLTDAEMSVQQNEANYRTGLVANILDITGLSAANNTQMKAQVIHTQYLLFTKLQLGLIAVLPYIVLLPSFLNGTIDLGRMIEHQASFALLVVNASVLIQLYPTLIQGNASEKRVQEIIT